MTMARKRATRNDVVSSLAVLDQGRGKGLQADELQSVVKDLIFLFPELGQAINKTFADELPARVEKIAQLERDLAEKKKRS